MSIAWLAIGETFRLRSFSARTLPPCVPVPRRYREKAHPDHCRSCLCGHRRRVWVVGQGKPKHCADWNASMGFPDGDCSKKPFWWEYPNQLDNEVGATWEVLGKPSALRLELRGNLSAFGMHGHLGAYRREVRPIALISVAPASRCRWSWVKEGR